MADELAVWLYGDRVAVIDRDVADLGSSYTERGAQRYPLGTPLLSLSLPVGKPAIHPRRRPPVPRRPASRKGRPAKSIARDVARRPSRHVRTDSRAGPRLCGGGGDPACGGPAASATDDRDRRTAQARWDHRSSSNNLRSAPLGVGGPGPHLSGRRPGETCPDSHAGRLVGPTRWTARRQRTFSSRRSPHSRKPWKTRPSACGWPAPRIERCPRGDDRDCRPQADRRRAI